MGAIGIAWLAGQEYGMARAQDTTQYHAVSQDVPWRIPPLNYLGADFAEAFRYRTLVGGSRAPLPAEGIYFGEAEFAPGAVYVEHRHPAPEIYYVISGEGEWAVNGETFTVGPGSTIYTPPEGLHRMENTGDEPLRTIWVWWGTRETLTAFPEIVGPPAVQPDSARFED